MADNQNQDKNIRRAKKEMPGDAGPVIAWIEAIDPDNTPGLQKPVKSTGERIGMIFKDKWTDELVISFLSYPSKAMFFGAAVIKPCTGIGSKGRRRRPVSKLAFGS